MVIEKLASQLGRKDEQSNIVLAQEIVMSGNQKAIEEIIHFIQHGHKNIQADCVKVAYEIGKQKPQFISPYTPIFIRLLKSPNNRLVWGAMQVLSTVAEEASDEMIASLLTIQSAIKKGSVITVDKGVLTLAKLAKVSKDNNEIIFPYLLEHLENCRTKELPQHAESTLMAVTDENKESFLKVLRKKDVYLTPPQLKRIQKIYKELE